MPRNKPRTGIVRTEKELPVRTARRWRESSQLFHHRQPNGFHDPFTYFHLVRELHSLAPWEPFTAKDLADHLNKVEPRFIWDPITVGRILTDLIDQWGEANPGHEHQPIRHRMTWAGRIYEMTDYPAAQKVLTNLIEDLISVGSRIWNNEVAERKVSRLESPLNQCASVMRLAA